MKPYKGTVETLGHMKLTGHIFWGNCAAPGCSRGRKLDMDKLIAIYGEDFDYVEGGDAICAAFVCDRCRHKGGRLTMDGQSSYAKAKGV